MGVTIIVPPPPSSRNGLVKGSKLQFSNEIPGNNQNFSGNEMMRKLCGLIVIDCRWSLVHWNSFNCMVDYGTKNILAIKKIHT